mmetsp:Transcript_14866/g.25871  ORF Transcript_14866/g.25871 Transcript_14866/m.25871 type:complete len:98 (+) Transcript_14866:388-681(+)
MVSLLCQLTVCSSSWSLVLEQRLMRWIENTAATSELYYALIIQLDDTGSYSRALAWAGFKDGCFICSAALTAYQGYWTKIKRTRETACVNFFSCPFW